MSGSEDFLRGIENTYGGPIEWKTYAFYVGRSGGGDRPVSLGGLLYVVSEKIVFEDFEREGGLLRLFGKKTAYRKFKIEKEIASLQEIRSISAAQAARAIRGSLSPRTLSPISPLGKILRRRVEMLHFEDEEAWFLEMYDRKGLNELLDRRKE